MTTDKIILHNASFQVHVGCTDAERAKLQEILITLKLETSIHKAATTDFLKDTINYSEVHNLVNNYIENHQHKLIETFANNIARLLLKECNLIRIRVILKKPQALAHKNVAYCAVDITRTRADFS